MTDWKSDVSYCKAEAARRVLINAYAKHYRMLLSEQRSDIHPLFSADPDIAAVWESIMHPTRSVKTRMFMVTVNPPDKYDWSHLLALWNRMLVYKEALRDAEMVLEQRSTDPDNPFGWHMHIASLSTGKSKAQTLQQFFNGLARVMPDASPTCVDHVWSPKAYSYVQGLKFGAEKENKMNCDRILRNKKSYEDIYKQYAV